MSCLEILVAITLHLGLEGDYNNIHPIIFEKVSKCKTTITEFDVFKQVQP